MPLENRRRWLSVVLEEALLQHVVSADDLLRHATPPILAKELPTDELAALLRAGLTRGTFDADLVVKVLGTECLAAYLPLPVLYACLAEAALKIIAEHPREARSRRRSPSSDLSVIAPSEVHPGAGSGGAEPEIEVLKDVR